MLAFGSPLRLDVDPQWISDIDAFSSSAALLIRCVDHSAAAGRTFLVSDDHDLATPALIRGLRRALGKSPRLLPVPPSVLRLAGRITGRAAEVERLIGSLQVDITHTREVLGWAPLVSVDEGLRTTAKWYLNRQ